MDTYRLTNETIDLLSEKIYALYTSFGVSRKDAMRTRLLLEEALIKYQTAFGEETELTFRTYRIFSQTRFSVRISCASFDPFTLEENPMGFMLRSIMENYEGSVPTWKYRNLENELLFILRKKTILGRVSTIGISLLAALVLGLICRIVLPAEPLAAFVTSYITLLADAYAGLFCVMAVLLTLFATTLSIVNIGDRSAVGSISLRMFARFYTISGILVLAVTLLALLLPTFTLSAESGSISLASKSVYNVLIGFIPTNLVEAFLNFNSVHIVIIGAMFGFSLLSMGTKGETLIRLFDECNMVALTTNAFINRFIFIYGGVELFSIVTSSEFSVLLRAGRMVVFIVLAEVLIFVFYTVFTCLRIKFPLPAYLRAMLPSFFLCLSTANYGASFFSIYDCLTDCGAEENIVNLGMNFGGICFRPACTAVFVLSALFMASSFGVEVSLVWVLMALLLSLILVASVPNVPGTSVSVLTLIYTQLGLPFSAISLMIAINAILQFLTVAVDVWCLEGEIMILSKTEQDKKGQR